MAECVRDTLKQIGIDDSHSRCHEGENGFALVTLKGNDRVFLGSNKGGVAREYGYDFTEEDFAYISQFNLIYTNLNSYIEDDLKSLKETGVAIAYDFPPDGQTRIWRRCARMSRWPFSPAPI